jgi:hypothetical protein
VRVITNDKIALFGAARYAVAALPDKSR